MEAHDAAAIHQRQQHRDIAGAINNLRVSVEKLRFEIRNDPAAAVTTPRAENRTNFGVPKHLEELRGPALDSPGKVTVGRGYPGTVQGAEAQSFEFPATLLKQIRFDIAGGRDNTNKVALPKGRWLDAIRH